MEQITCLYCGKPFRLYPSTQSQLFHSRACWKAWKESPEYFWQRIDCSNLDGCWTWTKSTNPAGYGVLTVNYDSWLAHRLAWTLTNGVIPDGLDVLHQCDNPPCCRPDHLFLGTIAINNADMISKGRANPAGGQQPKGEDHPMAKLTDDQVREIRAVYAEGKFVQKDIAVLFNVAHCTVKRIITHKSWSHVI